MPIFDCSHPANFGAMSSDRPPALPANQYRICCNKMGSQLNHQRDQHPDPHECSDILVTYSPTNDE